MKLQIQMKDPDGVYESIRDAATEWARGIEGVSDKERALLVETRVESLAEIASRWFRHGEYLVVEIDTEAGTCVVRPAS